MQCLIQLKILIVTISSPLQNESWTFPFNITKDYLLYLQSLRNELDQLLQYKISHPGITRWDRNSKEGMLLNTIVDLISSERGTSQDAFYADSDDQDDDGY